MLEKIRFKKDYLLYAIAVIMLLVCYRFAFTNTVLAWQVNRQLKDTLSRSADVSYQPDYLQRKAHNLDKIIRLYQADTAAFRSNVINSIALIAEKQQVKLSSVPVQEDAFRTSHFTIEKLDFEGSYFSLLKAISQLNSTTNIGMIRSEDWKLIRDNRGKTDEKKLVVEIYLEIVH